MHPLILKSQSPDGQELQATFLPDKGMNLISFKKGNIEIIDQSTQLLFDERFAGLGALIGPHFHRRHSSCIPKIADENLFAHIARVKNKGIQDPFSHGIARYAPWKAEMTNNQIKAVLTGKDLWNGVPLANLEGQNFKMEFNIELDEKELALSLSIVSDTDSLVGIHYYYHLPNGKGRILSEIRNQFINQIRKLEPVPSEWLSNSNQLTFDLNKESDYTFRPHSNALEGIIFLETEKYILKTHYSSPCEENCWQLYHPAGSSFVCIEPISAQDPRHPNLSVSSLKIRLEIQTI